MGAAERRTRGFTGDTPSATTEIASSSVCKHHAAQRGFVVVTGGSGGVMAAAAGGAREAGGVVVGLLPGDDRAACDPDVTIAIPTGLGQGRNALVVGAAEGVIAIGGSWGTLSEIALARRAGKPVVCLRGWQVTDVDGNPLPITVASSAAEAVELLAARLQHDQGHGASEL